MYFLRRRHGRKPQPDARRDTAPVPSPVSNAPSSEHETPYADEEHNEPIRQVVITQAKRPRVTAPEKGDCKPAGTFRSGTLHIAGNARSEPQHGKV